MLRAHLRFGIALTFGVLMIPAAAAALDPSCAVSQYVVRRWDAQSELQNTSIRAFVQTKDHYLWLGTASGLARFDGARFVFYDSISAPALGEGGISALAQSADGLLYFGTTAGAVLSYRDGRFARVSEMSTGSRPIVSLLPSRDGTLWAGIHERTLRHLKDGDGSSMQPFDAEGPVAMAEDA